MGFVGLGWWSGMLADAAQKSERIEIAACYSRSASKVEDFARKYGGRGMGSMEELLGSGDVDALVITVPNSQHAEQVILALEKKKHVFVEKPMALSVEECRRMNEAAAQSGCLLTVGHNNRRMTIYRKAREIIQEGGIGDIVLAEACMTGDIGVGFTPDKWRWHRNESPAGPFAHFTIHEADNLNYMVGPVKRVSAFPGRVWGKAEADDAVAAVLEFENRALGYLGGTVITPARDFCQVHGTEGVLLMDKNAGTLEIMKKGEPGMTSIPLDQDAETQRLNSLAEEMDEFASAIQGERRLEVTGETGLAAVAVMEACLRSFDSEGPVHILDLL
jgi:predicted dehydrogenase